MQQQTYKPKLSTSQQLQVGIEYYISKGDPITAITKYMLTDFIVNQITQDHQVVMLKQKPNPYINNHNNHNVNKKIQEKIVYQMNKQLQDQIVEIFGKEAADGIVQLYRKFQSGEKVTQWEFMIQNMKPMTKQQRMKIHTFVREKLINIQSNTLQGNKMKLKLNKKMKKINPASRNKYIHFVLFKSNIDTMGAIFKLSKITGINQKLFSTAGLKDKRGVTTQMVSVYNTQLAMLQKFYGVASRNKEMWIEGFKENMENDIGVGNLYGNQFGLILRLIDPKDACQIEDRVKSLREIGMINYFGMQRFGSCGTKTHMIGLKILKRQWRQLVQDLLLQDTKDEIINKMKKQCYEKQQYARAQRQLPNKYKIQKNLFKGFKRLGKNHQNVFQSLPRSIRTLYPHSLQSYLWNRIVSRRIQQFGLKLCIGDIVGKKITGYKLASVQIQQDKQNKINNQGLGEGLGEGQIKQNKQNKQQQQELQIQVPQQQNEQQKYEVQLITEENISKFAITDIVMPLYGPMINLPKQSLAYGYLMKEFDSLGLREEQFGENSKKLCFKGMYRKMIIRPTHVSYKIIQHKNAKDEVQSPFYVLGEELKLEHGERKAVQVVLQLPKSSYATMAIREILHVPSSFQAQMMLNKLYQTQNQSENKQYKCEKQDQKQQNKQEGVIEDKEGKEGKEEEIAEIKQ